jgi:hypothetical protein
VLEAGEVKGVCPHDSNPNDAHSSRMQSKKRFSYVQRCFMELFPSVGISMIVGMALQPGRERDRPDVGVVRKVTPTLHMFKVPLCLPARPWEMCWRRAIATEVEGAMIGA